MIRALVLVASLAGCDILWNIDKVPEIGDGGPPGEGMIEPTCTMVGNYGNGARHGMFTHCVLREATDVVIDHDFSTSSNTLCRYFTTHLVHDVTVCVIEGKTITVSGSVAVSGQAALVLAAADTMTIAGVLDLSQVTAAGATPAYCSPALGSGEDGVGGTVGGGGAGASYKRIGGSGGLGTSATKARPGMKEDFPDDIRGGCPGGHGGDGGSGTGGGPGGGGGAVYLIAKTAIHLTQTGVINASGRPGKAGTTKSGGGGGGAGGFIGIDSRVFTYDQAGAVVFANGAGGGGGGAGSMPGTAPASPAVPAPGGLPNGGAGAAADSQGTNGLDSAANGGGGGGGGEGHLVIFTPDPVLPDRAHLSPDPTPDI